MNLVFGYGSLAADFCEKNKIDIHKLASENGWRVDVGLLTHCFYKMAIPKVEFGAGYTGKQLKQLAKDLKK